MAGARRCLYFAGTLAVAVLAALVPAEVASASARDPAIPSPDRRGADSDAPGPSNTGWDAGSSPISPVATTAPPVAPPSAAPTAPDRTDPPGPDGPPGPQPSAPPTGQSSTDQGAPAVAPSADPPTRANGIRPALAPRPAPAGTTGPSDTPSPGAGWADVRGEGRGPDPGSQPHPVVAQPQAQDISGADDPWSFLRGPEAGAHLFLAGFVALLFSIGGLVAVGIRRHRW